MEGQRDVEEVPGCVRPESDGEIDVGDKEIPKRGRWERWQK